MFDLQQIKLQYPELPLGQASDLSQKKFGKLQPLYKTTSKNKATQWVCQCDCGTIKVIPAQGLNRGTTTSCGCYRKEMIKKSWDERREDIVGQKFGKLTVLEFIGVKDTGSGLRAMYLCECECGNKIEVSGNKLKTNHTKSCGCLHSYGEFVIQQILEKNNIIFKKEYTFNDLNTGNSMNRLRFDFAVFDNQSNLLFLIEFDGRQHFEGPDTTQWSSYGELSQAEILQKIQEHDNQKNQYCKINSIILKRIPHIDLHTLTIEDLFSNKYNI